MALGLSVIAFAVSCTGAAGEPESAADQEGVSAGAQAAPASAVGRDGSAGATSVPAVPTGEAAPAKVGEVSGSNVPGLASETPGPTACPGGMVLVEGDYCTEVEHECKQYWYSKANKKKVCVEFEPHAECVGQRVKKRFCIDQYAWPNQAGERPEVMNNFYQAQVKCGAVGKRLCTESEWTLSCEGPRMLPFPHGYQRDPAKCNGDRPWDKPNMNKVAARNPKELARLWQGVRSGSQPECVSEYGVADLPGNNDEVVSSETYASNFRGKFDSVHTGGPWYSGVRNQCRPKIYTHNEGFYYYFLGFRCCAEPDGQETDPRAPKQIRRNWDFSRVERLARFTREEMRDRLEQKAAGGCNCGPKERLCRTQCGTLLGPGVKDAVLGEGHVKPDPRSLKKD